MQKSCQTLYTLSDEHAQLQLHLHVQPTTKQNFSGWQGAEGESTSLYGAIALHATTPLKHLVDNVGRTTVELDCIVIWHK